MNTLQHPAPPVQLDSAGPDFNPEWPPRDADLDIVETFGLVHPFDVEVYDDECPVSPDPDDFDPDDFIPSADDLAWAAVNLNADDDDARVDALYALSAALDRMERGLEGCDHGGCLMGHPA